MTQRKLKGFTQIECMMTAGILVVAMSTVLPAIQTAREKARMTHCKNNLKMIGLGIHNYHDVFTSFPPGWVSRRPQGVGHPSTGWIPMLLPFLDQAPLFNQLDVDDPVYTEQNMPLLKQELKFAICPTGGMDKTNPIRGDFGLSHYAGLYGSSPIPRAVPSYAETTFWPGNRSFTNRNTIKLSSRDHRLLGVFWVNSNCRIRNIIDGTSNTFMVGEKSVLSGGAIWPGPRSNFHESDVLADTSYSSPLNKSETGFSSRHVGGVQFLMCDGSVKFIKHDIDTRPLNSDPKKLGVLQRLGAINDQQIVTF